MQKYIHYLFLLIILGSCTKEIEPAASVGTIRTDFPNGSNAPFTVNFTAQNANANAYKWEFGDSKKSTSTNQNPSFTYDSPGNYKVIFKAIGSAGSAGTTTIFNISVPIPNAPVFNISTLTNNGFAPCEITCTPNSSSDITSYWWTVEDLNGNRLSDVSFNFSASAQKIPFSKSGTFTVKLVVSNKYLGTNSSTQQIVIKEPIITSATYNVFKAGGTGNENAYFMQTDNLGNIYLAGQNGGNALFDGNTKNIATKNKSFFVAKYFNNGTLDWYRDDVTNSPTSIATGLVLDGLGNVCVAFDDLAQTNRVFGYVKLKRPSGQDAGIANYTDPSDGSAFFNVRGITVDKSNNILTTGTVYYPKISKDKRVIIFKYDALNTISTTFYLTRGSLSRSEGFDITAFDDDNIYVTGSTFGDADWLDNGNILKSGNGGNAKTFIAKFNKNLKTQWIKIELNTSAGYQPDNFTLSNIVCDNIGNVYMGGCFKGSNISFDDRSISNRYTGYFVDREHYLISYKPDGTIRWLKLTASKVANYGIGRDRSENILLTGSTTDASGEKVYLQKYDSNGNIVLEKYPINSGGLSAGGGIIEDINGNIWVSGRFNGATSIINGGQSMTTRGLDDAFMLKYNK